MPHLRKPPARWKEYRLHYPSSPDKMFVQVWEKPWWVMRLVLLDDTRVHTPVRLFLLIALTGRVYSIDFEIQHPQSRRRRIHPDWLWRKSLPWPRNILAKIGTSLWGWLTIGTSSSVWHAWTAHCLPGKICVFCHYYFYWGDGETYDTGTKTPYNLKAKLFCFVGINLELSHQRKPYGYQ